MHKKTWSLIAGIASFIVFIGYLSEPGPHIMFGVAINMWIVRLAWLLIAVANFSNYMKIKKSEKEST